MSKIDIDKFVRSLVERYYEKIHIDPTTTKCWLDSVLEDQGLEYKDGEIVEIEQESEDERIRKALVKAVSGTLKGNKLFGTDITREEALAWLEKQAQSTTITIPKDLKGTDTDGGVVGERGELGKAWLEKELLDHIDDVARRLHPLYSLLGHFITDYNKKTDKIISLLQSVILAIPRGTYVPTTIYKNPLDPDPNTLGGWGTNALLYGADYDIDTDKIKQDETNKPKS